MSNKINNRSEIFPLKKVMVHSPDGGIGNVPAHKLHDWLYDDILDVKATQLEYRTFQATLMLFLSPGLLFKGGSFAFDKESNLRKNKAGKKFLQTNPEKLDHYMAEAGVDASGVVDTQFLLQQLIQTKQIAARDLVISIASIERLHPERRDDLLHMLAAAANDYQFAVELVKTLLTGKLEYKADKKGKVHRRDEDDIRFIFPPIPNFIFTRDIGVTIGDHILITKPKYDIRGREVRLCRFIAENLLLEKQKEKIIAVSEDDDYFQLEEKIQPEHRVSYEGGDIMMISDRHVLIGCSERTSPYAIQKIVHRLFWENIKTGNPDGIDIVSVIKIGEKRSQMHIDTVFTHIREDVWVLHSPLSEVWKEQQSIESWRSKNYNDELQHKSASQIEREKGVGIFQFCLSKEGKKLKKQYKAAKTDKQRRAIKVKFRKLDFLLRTDAKGLKYKKSDCHYKQRPKGVHDLLTQISVKEFGVSSASKVKFALSGRGVPPFDSREQWTDACNLLTLRPGVSVGYDRNYRTALHFNEIMKGEPVSANKDFVAFIVERNIERFRDTRDSNGKEMDLNHLIHASDLIRFIAVNKMDEVKTKRLIKGIKNAIIMIPSNELSRARGGSHCMTMPLERANSL